MSHTSLIRFIMRYLRGFDAMAGSILKILFSNDLVVHEVPFTFCVNLVSSNLLNSCIHFRSWFLDSTRFSICIIKSVNKFHFFFRNLYTFISFSCSTALRLSNTVLKSSSKTGIGRVSNCMRMLSVSRHSGSL